MHPVVVGNSLAETTEKKIEHQKANEHRANRAYSGMAVAFAYLSRKYATLWGVMSYGNFN